RQIARGIHYIGIDDLLFYRQCIGYAGHPPTDRRPTRVPQGVQTLLIIAESTGNLRHRPALNQRRLRNFGFRYPPDLMLASFLMKLFSLVARQRPATSRENKNKEGSYVLHNTKLRAEAQSQ